MARRPGSPTRSVPTTRCCSTTRPRRWASRLARIRRLRRGKETKALVHFDRNGFGYTLNRETGELLVAEKYDPKVNWATHVDMKTGRPQVVSQYSTQSGGEDHNSQQICPAALGSKDQQPAA